ncbi:DegT/DnrJ/EryC1/StrS family aminotransferase [bacterium]|nr:DegT/DnrJ/EryC1/StrS family aminotransferase [bacterium]MBU1071695.1 DegT/DnrJ/EryC1/StrS family aminotransferase [bacterium]MBU1676662.1 DegT/DnrJ/EryC1/StrS family aminotransferase [bacterium]
MATPLSRPDITDLERQAVMQVLRSHNLALGPKLREFEKAMADYHGRKHAIAVNSGTSGLHLAMIALGLEPGDEVITTPFSFVASTNCILYERGEPRFVDIDRDTWNMDLAQLDAAVTPRTRGLLPVHVFGVPCDMKAIRAFAADRGLWVVEDACEAIGAYSRDTLAGSDSDIAVLAFYPNKQLTTGEGGMVLTDDDDLAAVMRSAHNQGRAPRAGWLSHERLGYNYRMSDIQAALGLAQLSRLDEILAKRTQVARWYDERLSGHDWVRGQTVPDGVTKSWFVYVVELDASFGRVGRDAVLAGLRERGVGCSNYFTPIHLQPFIRERLGTCVGDFPVTESVADRTVALPFFSNLKETEVDGVCAALQETAASARRRCAADR